MKGIMQVGTYTFPGNLVKNRVSTLAGYPSAITYTPNVAFKRIFSKGTLIRGNHKSPNPWNYRYSERQNGPISATYFLVTGSGYIKDFYSGTYTPIQEGLATYHAAELAAVAADCTYKLMDNIRGQVDISIDLMQYRQTKAIPGLVVKTVSQLKHLRLMIKHPHLPIKAAGAAWLLFQYGIKPAYQTIWNGLDNLINHYENLLQTIEATSSRRKESKVTGTGWPDRAYWTFVAKTNGLYRCKQVVRLRIPKSSLVEASRWSSLNPASIAWELVPFSFVVDWFFNIGAHLRAVETRIIYNSFFEGGYQSVSFDVRSTQYATRGGSSGQESWSGYYSTTARDKGMDRKILTGLPAVPRISLNPALGSGRLLNASALLTTFLRH